MVKKNKGLAVLGFTILFIFLSLSLSLLLPLGAKAQSTQNETHTCYQSLVQQLTTADGFSHVIDIAFSDTAPTNNLCDTWTYELIQSKEGLQTFLSAVGDALKIVMEEIEKIGKN